MQGFYCNRVFLHSGTSTFTQVLSPPPTSGKLSVDSLILYALFHPSGASAGREDPAVEEYSPNGYTHLSDNRDAPIDRPILTLYRSVLSKHADCES